MIQMSHSKSVSEMLCFVTEDYAKCLSLNELRLKTSWIVVNLEIQDSQCLQPGCLQSLQNSLAAAAQVVKYVVRRYVVNRESYHRALCRLRCNHSAPGVQYMFTLSIRKDSALCRYACIFLATQKCHFEIANLACKASDIKGLRDYHGTIKGADTLRWFNVQLGNRM